MPLLDILPDTDPLMRKTCKRVRRVDEKFRELVDDMYETMVDGWGIGLAAIQIGLRKRFFIYEIPKRPIKGFETCPPDPDLAEDETGEPEEVDEPDVPEETVDSVDPEDPEDSEESDDSDDEEPSAGYTGEYLVCINPRVTAREGKVIEEEGCLSRSGWVAKVERDFRITFQAYDLDMNKFERTVEGLEARCVLHEIDHLDGILFTDRAIPDTLREVTDEEPEEAGDDESQEEASEKVEEEHAIELEDSTVAGD